MRSLFIIISLLSTLAYSYAQDTGKLIQESVDLANKGEHTRSLALAETLYDLQPNTFEAYSIIAYNQLCLGNYSKAESYLQAGLHVEPTEYSLYVSSGYYQALMGNTENAKNYFRESIKFYPEGTDIHVILDEMKSMGAKRNQQMLFSELAAWYQQTWQTTKQRYPKTEFYFAEISTLDNPEKVKQVTRQYVEKFNSLGWYDAAINIYSHASSMLNRSGYLTEALEMAQAGYQQYLKNGNRNNYFITSYLLGQLIESYTAVGNHERAVQHLNEMVWV